MTKTTRLSCTALLALLGIGLAQASPILGQGFDQGQGAPGHANGPDLEFGYCSPDSEKITGFARCDRRNDRGPQNGGAPTLDLEPDTSWQDWRPPPQGLGTGGTGPAVDVSEPATLALLGLGLLGLVRLRRRTG